MYAKIFTQVFESTLANNWKFRHVFEDMLKLCNQEGICDMTHEAIAARTRVPLKLVKQAIVYLESPDPKSRSKVENGVRIKRLSEDRDWGWWIVNYETYRGICTDSQYREKNRDRVRRFRAKTKGIKAGNVTEEKKRYRHVTSPSAYASSPSSSSGGTRGANGFALGASIDSICAILFRLYKRPAGQRLSYKAEHDLAEISRRPNVLAELAELELLERKEDSYFPKSMEALLEQWDKTVDRARNFIAKPKTSTQARVLPSGEVFNPAKDSHADNNVLF